MHVEFFFEKRYIFRYSAIKKKEFLERTETTWGLVSIIS